MRALKMNSPGKPESIDVAALRVKNVDLKPLGAGDADMPKLPITRLNAGLIYDKPSSSGPGLDGGFIR
jgi:hypothetical protein